MCGLSVDTRHYKVKYAFLVMSRFTKDVFISGNATIKKIADIHKVRIILKID